MVAFAKGLSRALLGVLLCGGGGACGEARSDGTASGGVSSGGVSSGGVLSGGVSSGGVLSGGAPAGGAPTGGVPAACDDAGTSFSVELAEVTGRLTRNGEPWIPLPGLQFVPRDDRELDFRRGIAVTDRGDGTFAAALPHGAYDVRLFLGRSAVIDNVEPDGVLVQEPRHVELEFPTVQVSGEVHLAGAVFPGAADRGLVCLRGTDGNTNSFCANPSSGVAATFALEVPRGRAYELRWSRGGAVETNAPLETVPYGEQIFGVRSFNQDTVVDLDIDTPSLIVSGSVTWDGTPFTDLSPRPTGFVGLGPLTVNLAEQGDATFQARVLAGTYAPTVYLSVPGSLARSLNPCAEPGCALSEDTEWMLDVSSPRTAVVEGQIDFVSLSGDELPSLPSDGGGIVHLDLQPEAPGTTLADPNAFGGAYTAKLDPSRRFRREDLPFGTYAVSYQRADHPSAPVGMFRFEGALVVDREQVSWRQTATVAPVVIDVTVNGQAMPDDGQLEGEPRGVLLFADVAEDAVNGPYALRLELGENGPVRLERVLLTGRYAASVSAYTYLGRTYLRGLKQDVLPVGQLDLGTLDVSAAASGPDPTPLPFDLKVREVAFDIQHTELLLTGASPHVMASLTSREGGHPFWAPVPTVGEELRLLVYAGCYSVAAVPTEAQWFPDSDGEQEETRVGTLCTCDSAMPMP